MTRRRFQASMVTSHPFARGDKVTVFQVKLEARPFTIPATVVTPVADRPGLYYVRYRGDSTARLAVLHAAWQRDPDGVLEALLEAWRATLDPSVLADSSVRRDRRKRT